MANRETIYLCPSNMRVGTMWHIECPVQMTDDYINNAMSYKMYSENQDKSSYAKQYAHLWKGSIESTTWDIMYNNWAFYNTNNEMGYYAHYYIMIE